MRKVFSIVMILAMLLAFAPAAFAQEATPPSRLDGREVPASVTDLKLDSPLVESNVSTSRLDPSLRGAQGPTQVVVRLSSKSVSERNIYGRSAQRMQSLLAIQQSSLLSRMEALDSGMRIIGRVQLVMNAVFVEVDASVLSEIAADPMVSRVAPVANYEMDLSETVPYIGASDVQAAGFDGTGVRVAVLDSGIDYTHADLGGSGDVAEYDANDPTIIEPGTFPTAKVIGGYDFVGEAWDGSAGGPPEAPDPDPLDKGTGAGHGTHVSDIIAGQMGVAPGASLYGVKVCSSVSTACSGIALIEGMEFAVDPNGDGDPSDHVDLVNMSLGSNYGQPFEDDLSFAVNNTTMYGVLTMAAAGNASNLPYIVSTPSAALSALSVAETQVPSAVEPQLEVTAPPGIAGTYSAAFQPWSVAPTSVISGPVLYGDTDGTNLDGCAPFTGDLTGYIVLVDRGACNFTLKISNISQAGGLAGIIGLVAAGDPFGGGDGGDRPIDIPGYMVSQADSNTFKSGLPDTAITIDPAQGIPLIGAMNGESARGPRNQDSLIKPEIGAPGASVSAIAGTGDGTGPFGGTSGATPMVTGSAALLKQAYPDLIPAEIKARLMNTGDTEIYTKSATDGVLAPITRIGGGEVRVNWAYTAPAAAWDDENLTGALSFGFTDVDKNTVNLFKTVRVRNYSDDVLVYNITPTFRYQDDADNGAVEVSAPQKVTIKPHSDATFQVKLTIHGDLLRGNYMNGGSQGASPGPLDLNEYDGYLFLDDGSQPIHMAWHILPRQAANTIVRPGLKFDKSGVGQLSVVNRGVGISQIDAYSLVGVSDNLPAGAEGGNAAVVDLRAVGIQTFPVPADYCGPNESFLWAFAINTWERLTLPVTAEYDIYLDTTGDGVYDYVLFNANTSGGFGEPQVVWALDLATGDASAFFYVENATNTANTIFYICGDQIGMDASDFLTTQVSMDVYAFDAYFTGNLTDSVLGMSVSPLGERYLALTEDVPALSKTTFTTLDFGEFEGSDNDLGLLFITNGDRGTGARGGATADTEAVLVFPQ
jgi:subtilisin family serine protease